MSKSKKGKSSKSKGTPDLSSPDLLVNRELSWLEFNDRVLRLGLDRDLPLCERLKFLAIVSSNLDEFFMVRVAGLRQQKEARVRKKDPSGMTPTQQLNAITRRTKEMVAEQSEGIAEVVDLLAANDVRLLQAGELDGEQRVFLKAYFENEVHPLLTLLAVDEMEERPALPGLQLMLALRLQSREGQEQQRFAVVPIPSSLPRFIAVPAAEGLSLVRLEDVVAINAQWMLPRDKVLATAPFRFTRDGDVDIRDDAADDLLKSVERTILSRRVRAVVRLEVAASADRKTKAWLRKLADLKPAEVYEIDGPLDAGALMEVALRPGLDHLRAGDWPPQPAADLIGTDGLWETVREKDVMLVHPYESFEPVVRLVEQAADDPDVLAIKQTLYRTSGNSPIIAALERAARNGKQIVVLVELKARFDEEQNVQWARRLEQVGAFVIYGIAGYKTHSKALMIVRREASRIRRYVHLATGNYNDKTAKLYSDIGIMTADDQVAADVAAFFNMLTGYSDAVGWSKLSIAPGGLRNRFEELIEREIKTSTKERPGLIMAKCNSLQDPGVIKALYRAGLAGVQIRLNVRGICCLRPGLKGVSENIEVTSIVDRFLEHARIYYFANGGHEEVYLSSADWMTRNLDKRLEILFPVTDKRLRKRTVDMLETYLADNVKARRMLPDGSYEPVPQEGKPVRAQEKLYRKAVSAAEKQGKAPTRFKPLTRPQK
ncbi:MAG: polyphosphate kinase 1 [Phycisphaerae bacterium]